MGKGRTAGCALSQCAAGEQLESTIGGRGTETSIATYLVRDLLTMSAYSPNSTWRGFATTTRRERQRSLSSISNRAFGKGAASAPSAMTRSTMCSTTLAHRGPDECGARRPTAGAPPVGGPGLQSR
ncbi:hypothetical protein CZ774_05420 [Frigoribacterium sp. JB110]|nr:hypothetical protein CZ774_05420 [Frigoribacterium sp. JB110]